MRLQSLYREIPLKLLGGGPSSAGARDGRLASSRVYLTMIRAIKDSDQNKQEETNQIYLSL
uniref:Uncharacterized protein n=1 Tax=Rhizophora mucronata TaxID=61149 RepID=A0A2P2M842_RHIMU